MIFSLDNKEEKFFSVFFYIISTFFAIALLSRVFNSNGYFMDMLEHIHAAFLVSEGFVPYIDFFEHHNPLLWYLFAPVTKLFERQIIIVYIARIIAFGGNLGILYMLYQVAYKYGKNHIYAQTSILLCMLFPFMWYDAQNLRPDIFMYLFILLSINSFLDYLEKRKTLKLCLSYLYFFIAFLFIQKTVLYGIGFIFANLYLLYNKKIILKDILYALIVPVLLFCIFIFLLYNAKQLDNWFYYNFIFNNLLIKYYRNGNYLDFSTLLLALITCYYYKHSYKGSIIFFIWLASCFSIFYFAPHFYYCFFYIILTSLILARPITYCLNKKFVISMCILLSVFIISFSKIFITTNTLKPHIEIMEYIIKNTNKNDKLLNAHIPYGVFNYDTDFYWFGFHNIVIVSDLFTNKSFNYNEQIKMNKPKYVFMNDSLFDKVAYKNSTWINRRNSSIIQKAAKGDLSYLDNITEINYDYWRIDINFIKNNYKFVKTFDRTELWKRIDN